MKEHPILFSGSMVRAIIEGKKTQTRRIINPQPIWVGSPFVPFKTPDADPNGIINCKYGKPGDMLWVRETWGVGTRPDQSCGWIDGIEYKADEPYCKDESLPIRIVDENLSAWDGKGWKPSIHMFRWMSRINLIITDVRVERLQDITEDDAKAEGVTTPYIAPREHFPAYVPAFADLWDSLNEKSEFGWSKNPWVFVIEFKKVLGRK